MPPTVSTVSFEAACAGGSGVSVGVGSGVDSIVGTGVSSDRALEVFTNRVCISSICSTAKLGYKQVSSYKPASLCVSHNEAKQSTHILTSRHSITRPNNAIPNSFHAQF